MKQADRQCGKMQSGQKCKRQAVLLGNYGTKRTDYLCQAAKAAGLPMIVADWQEYLEGSSLPDIRSNLDHKNLDHKNLDHKNLDHKNLNHKNLECTNGGSGQKGQEYPQNRYDQSGSGRAVFLKIDPPVWDSYRLGELDSLANDYINNLEQLAYLGSLPGSEIEFLNHPHAIVQLLDKRRCKAALLQAGLPVTEEICADPMKDIHIKAQTDSRIFTAKGLLDQMRACRIYQVFIKPVSGSGAAGVSAFRWNPSSGRMMLYTCAFLQPEDGLVNTKRLRCFTDPKEVLVLLDQILQLDCMVERWYAKEEYQGYSYDLRAVVQEGRLDFLLARLSKGPITNLHLNNHPMETDQLGLSASVLEHIEQLCKKAVDCFPGLRSAGIDLLLEKGKGRPRIIEMNAQGDLIYRDIFHENRIYRHQAEIMRRWCMETALE